MPAHTGGTMWTTTTSSDARSADRPLSLDFLHRVITDRSCSVLSLNVFDTILWHRVPRATDMLGLLGARLRQDGRCPPWLTDAAFRRLRIAAAEQACARRVAPLNQISLFDIWREMPLTLFGGALLEELVQEEVAVERECTSVDLHIADIIHLAEKHDMPLVLVTDTYFTEDQLSYLLDRHELDPLRNARIFRSQEYGVTKAGGLWPVVVDRLGVSPHQVVHVGADEHADHAIAEAHGLRTVHYPGIDESFRWTLDREQEQQDPIGPHGIRIDPRHGDFGLTGLRRRTLPLCPAPVSSPTGTAWRYGASVLGPVLTGFAEWVASRAQDCGTPVVWCPMREGELLSTMINSAVRARGGTVVAKPLWLSRHVTSLASLDCFDRDAVHEFILRSYRLTVSQLLATLRLRPGDVPGVAEVLDVVLDHDGIADQLSRALTENAHVRNRIATTIRLVRGRLLGALTASGALEFPELTLVDLGWGGTIQVQLEHVLRAMRTGVRTAGLYLATEERSTRLHRAGLRAEGYLGQAGHPREVVETLRRSPEAIEQCINSLCGSLIDFADDGSPVLAPQESSASQDVERRAAQDGIVAFQHQWNRYTQNSDGSWPDLARDNAARRLGNILTAALKAPTGEEAALFGKWLHDDNFGSSVVTRILPEDLLSAVPYLSPNDLDELDMRDAFWPALLAASDPHLGAAARALASGCVDRIVFDPSEGPFETRLRFRTGDGAWHDGPSRPVRINHNGLSFARLNLSAHDVRDVSVAIPGRPAIVRIDWITATVTARGVCHDLRWDCAQDFAGLVCAECTWLGGNMIEFESPGAAVWLPLAARVGAPISSARVTVAFAMLPQSVLTPRMPSAPTIARILGRMRAEYRTRGAVGVAAGAARALRRSAGSF